MPMYATRCPACGAEGSIFRRIAERDDVPTCECGARVERVLTPTQIAPEFEPYESPKHPGTWITSRAQQKEDLKRVGAFILEPGVQRDIQKNREREVARTNALIEQRVDETAAALAASGRLK